MNTVSTQRPNLNPVDRKCPEHTKPRLACTPIEAAFALSPITAMTWRYLSAVQSAIISVNTALPTPLPCLPCLT